jgi:hypothetical protein
MIYASRRPGVRALLRECVPRCGMDEREPRIAKIEPVDPRAAMADGVDVLVARSPDQLAGCHPSLLTLHEYWTARRGSRPMPARTDIDPIDLKPLLPVLILIDVVADARRYVYRVVGTHEVEIRGADPTGKPVAEAYYGETAEDTLYYLDRVVREQQPILYRGTYRPFSTRIQREDVLYLPLSQDGETVNMIMVLGHIDWLKDDTCN